MSVNPNLPQHRAGSPLDTDKLLAYRRALLEPGDFRSYLLDSNVPNELVDHFVTALAAYERDKNFKLDRYLDDLTRWANLHRHEGAIPTDAPLFATMYNTVVNDEALSSLSKDLTAPANTEVGDYLIFYVGFTCYGVGENLTSSTVASGLTPLYDYGTSRSRFYWAYKIADADDVTQTNIYTFSGTTNEGISIVGACLRIPAASFPDGYPFGPVGIATGDEPITLTGLSGDWLLVFAHGSRAPESTIGNGSIDFREPIETIIGNPLEGDGQGRLTHLQVGLVRKADMEQVIEDGITADYATGLTADLDRRLLAVGVGSVSASPGFEPAPHALGGEKHTADFLENLNALIIDANLDDENDTRPPESHDNTAHGTISKNSIEEDSDLLQLVGDEATPSADSYYGTDEVGVKGYHALPEVVLGELSTEQLILLDNAGAPWLLTVGTDGALTTVYSTPELISRTNHGTSLTLTLDADRQVGDVLVVASAHRDNASISVSGLDNFPRLANVSDGSVQRCVLYAKVLTEADLAVDDLTLSSSHSNRNTQSLIFRNAGLLQDADTGDVIVSTVAGTGDTIAAIDPFPGGGIALWIGSNYNSGSTPTLTSDDTYVSEWLAEASFMDFRGYLADVAGIVNSLTFAWGGNQYGMARIIITAKGAGGV